MYRKKGRHLCLLNINMHEHKPNKPKTNPRRVPLWLPYLDCIVEKPKGTFTFNYSGGSEKTKLGSVQSIMIYGDSKASLDISTLDKITRSGIPIIIHRRNMGQPIYIIGGGRSDPQDTISRQTLARSQSRKSNHIARQLLLAKFRSCNWLVPELPLPPYTDVSTLRNIEARHAKKYWQAFFLALGHPEYTRRSDNQASIALDASSKFVSGIILRWLTYHHLSPYHGFLHEPTDYPSLVYDLMEPYRGVFERILLQRWKTGGVSPDNWMTSGIDAIKESLDERVYTGLTRQIVTRQELLHGSVLSLKYYLLGKQRKFLVPIETKPNGGRPPKVNFLLYGRHAGKTDFWKEAKLISQDDIKLTS